MTTTRVNSFRKTLAQIERKTPSLRYTGTYRALTEENRKYFDAYAAEPWKPKRVGSEIFYEINKELKKIHVEKHHCFDREESVTMEYTFHYKDDYETEAERLAKVKHEFAHRLGQMYLKENVQFVEGIDYALDIVKEDLTEPVMTVKK